MHERDDLWLDVACIGADRIARDYRFHFRFDGDSWHARHDAAHGTFGDFELLLIDEGSAVTVRFIRCEGPAFESCGIPDAVYPRIAALLRRPLRSSRLGDLHWPLGEQGERPWKRLQAKGTASFRPSEQRYYLQP
ncbi:hypothetical protein [Xanthomonas sp. 1678]|uniref:hypothetical protein n=1 Tax=Xanthomonas sp. 1678 TaxID=3158788 RepID=UPI0028596D4A|nr:hypothetical protein [Xanthomonas translucens]